MVTSLSRLRIRFLLGHRRGNQTDDVEASDGVDSQDLLKLVKWVWSFLREGALRNTNPGTVNRRR